MKVFRVLDFFNRNIVQAVTHPWCEFDSIDHPTTRHLGDVTPRLNQPGDIARLQSATGPSSAVREEERMQSLTIVVPQIANEILAQRRVASRQRFLSQPRPVTTLVGP